MKNRVTKTVMKKAYNNIISVRYCGLSSLLTFASAFGYSDRAEGWACDYYEVDGVLISTGYSPIDNKNVKVDNSLQKEYEQKAREIITNNNLDDTTKKEQIQALLSEFVQKCIN